MSENKAAKEEIMDPTSINPNQPVTRRDALGSLLAALVAPAALSQAGCSFFEPQGLAEGSFFNGTVTAVVFQTAHAHVYDYAKLTFKEPGAYQVSFSITPGKPRYKEELMPMPFSIEVMNDETPREVLVEQQNFPLYLTITISKGKQTEHQSFTPTS